MGNSLFKISFSKHFMGSDVRAIGLKSFICLIVLDLGTGVIFEVFQISGIILFLI